MSILLGRFRRDFPLLMRFLARRGLLPAGRYGTPAPQTAAGFARARAWEFVACGIPASACSSRHTPAPVCGVPALSGCRARRGLLDENARAFSLGKSLYNLHLFVGFGGNIYRSIYKNENFVYIIG